MSTQTYSSTTFERPVITEPILEEKKTWTDV